MPGDKPSDQRFLHTVQVRVRKRSPLIERRNDTPEPGVHVIDDEATSAEFPPAQRTAIPEPQIEAPITGEQSELASSIYERLEETDRSDELLQAQAELESELDRMARESADNLTAAMPTSAPSQEETRTYMGPYDTPRSPPPEAPSTVRASQERAAAPRPTTVPVFSDRTERVVPQSPLPTLPRPGAASLPQQPDRAVTSLQAPQAPKAPDRAETAIESAVPIAKRPDPTAKGRAGRRRMREVRLDTEPTPIAPPLGPRVSKLLDEDETVVASEAPQGAHHWTDQNEPGIRLVRRERAQKVGRPAAPPPLTAARPQNRLALLGTDAAGDVMKEHLLQAMGGNLPNLKTPALKLVQGELSVSALAILEGILQGRFDEEKSGPATSAKRALERLVNEKYYGQLSPKEQATLLHCFLDSPSDVTTIKSAIALLKTGVVRRLGQLDRQYLLQLFAGLSTEARVRVAQLGARKLRGRSALEDRDMQDQTLVSHLHHLVHGKGYAELLTTRGASRNKSVNIVLGAVAHPERLSFEEGSPGVLSMLEFGLADSAPAEFARLWRHLAFDDMVAPLAGPAALDLAARLRADPTLSLEGAETPLRHALSILCELSRPTGRARKPTFIMPGGHGIDADVVSKALEFLYGFGFTVVAGAQNTNRHLRRIPSEPHRLPPVFVTVLFARGEKLFVFDHMDDDWVYLRAPRGRSSKQRGALRIDPKREVVDPDTALDRIPKASFDEKVGVGLIPRL